MNHKKTFSKVGLILFIASILLSVVQIACWTIADYIPVIANNADLYFLAGMLPMCAIAYPISLYLFKKVPIQLSAEKKTMKIHHLISACIMCYAMALIFNLIGTFITGIIGTLKGDAVENVIETTVGNIGPVPNFIYFVLCAPIFEELLFRKAVISRISEYGDRIAILLSAFLFGLFHGNLLQGGYAFILGIFFGYVFVKTGRIIYSIIMHMFVNFTCTFLGPLLMKLTDYNEYQLKLTELMNSGASEEQITALITENAICELVMGGWSLIIIAFLITGTILFLKNRKKFVFATGEICFEKGKSFSTIFINLGMGLYCIIWILTIVLQLLQ